MDLGTVGTIVVSIGTMVMFLGGLFGIAVAVKTLFFTKIDPGKEFVTRQELRVAMTELETKLTEFKVELTARMDKASDYAHTIAHEQANVMHQIGIKVERLLVMRELDAGIRKKEGDIHA